MIVNFIPKYLLGEPSFHKLNPTFTGYCDKLFASRISFYRFLDREHKNKFIVRVHEFIKAHEWKGFNDFVPESEHRAIIAACAVQLTFGLRDYKLEHIKRIFIAPEIFYSRLLERDVKGLTTPMAVYFSWDDVQKGIDIDNDAYNLALHEFAHALDISKKLEGYEWDDNFISEYNYWEIERDRVFDQMQNSEDDHFLRDYAFTNKHEFFAVCTENFFEKSDEFKNNDLQLYTALCRLLNLNPLNTNDNYAVVLANKYGMAETPNFDPEKYLTPQAIILIGLFGLIIFLGIDSNETMTAIGGGLVITYWTFKLTHKKKSGYSTEYLIKAGGVFLFGIFPVFYAILSYLLRDKN